MCMAKMSNPTETEQCIDFLMAAFQVCWIGVTTAHSPRQNGPCIFHCMMKKLDLNSDGQIDFQEFLNLIGGMAIACQDSFKRSTYCWK
ncbi:unnamed protein product [Nyctereutes procyonoides]|uniref:(raccoon dog) hypothetical protein n=1 Tax=Nyctereutes procyonoides TaxID=34880 RepID=A0A811Z0F4_NYCPR|nr:unnamed protein product [Nyctereutes procyonoides]